MALQIIKATGYNINATYFKIIEIYIDWLGKNSLITIGGWLDQASRDEGFNPAIKIQISFNGDNFVFDPSRVIMIDAYTTIKTLSAWSGAKDI